MRVRLEGGRRAGRALGRRQAAMAASNRSPCNAPYLHAHRVHDLRLALLARHLVHVLAQALHDQPVARLVLARRRHVCEGGRGEGQGGGQQGGGRVSRSVAGGACWDTQSHSPSAAAAAAARHAPLQRSATSAVQARARRKLSLKSSPMRLCLGGQGRGGEGRGGECHSEQGKGQAGRQARRRGGTARLPHSCPPPPPRPAPPRPGTRRSCPRCRSCPAQEKKEKKQKNSSR